MRLLSSGIKTLLKRSPFLLGIKRARKKKRSDVKASEDILDDEEWDLQYDLLRPDQIVIVDDTNAYQFFGDSLFSAPQEDIIEGICVINVRYFFVGLKTLFQAFTWSWAHRGYQVW